MSKWRNATILSYTHLLNATINNVWLTIEKKCDTLCRYESCNSTATATFISDPIYPSAHEVEFFIDLFALPSMTARYLPVIRVNDLFFQLISSFNFFTGLTLSHLFDVFECRKIKRNCLIRRIFNDLQVNISRANELLRINEEGTHTRALMKKLLSIPLNNYRMLKRVCLYSVCLAGSISHIFFAITSYMEYPSILESSRPLESSRNYGLTICLDWLEIPHLSQADRPTTIQQVFRGTPPAHDFVSDCSYWGLSRRRFNDLTHPSDRILFTQNNSAICNKLFRVEKFLRHNYMCYKIDPVKGDNWTRSQMNNVLTDQKVLFMVSVKNSRLTDHYRVLVSTSDGYPVVSMMWSPLVTKTNANLWFTIAYHMYVIAALPPPYSGEKLVLDRVIL